MTELDFNEELDILSSRYYGLSDSLESDIQDVKEKYEKLLTLN